MIQRQYGPAQNGPVDHYSNFSSTSHPSQLAGARASQPLSMLGSPKPGQAAFAYLCYILAATGYELKWAAVRKGIHPRISQPFKCHLRAIGS